MNDKIKKRVAQLSEDGRLMELLRGSGFVLLFKILGALSGYAFTILVFRWAGKGGYGVFELAFTALTLITVLARLGLESAIVKYISGYMVTKEYGKAVRIYQFSFWIILALSIALGAGLFVFATPLSSLFDGQNLSEAFQWAALAIPAYSILQLNGETLRGLKRMKEFSYLQNGTLMLLATMVFWLWFDRDLANGVAAVKAYVGAVYFLTIFSFYYLRTAYVKDLGSPTMLPVGRRGVISSAIPMMISGSMFLVMSWTDTLMIGHFMTDADVGLYRFVFKMATLITFAQFAINSIVAPMISGFMADQNIPGLRKIIHQIGLINLVMSLPIFLIFAVFPEWILDTAGNGDMSDGVTVFVILAIGQVVNALCGPVMYTLNMSGHEKVSQRIMLWTATLNLVANLVLIPMYGILGAAIATTVSMMIWNIVASFKVYQFFQVVTLPIPWKWRRK